MDNIQSILKNILPDSNIDFFNLLAIITLIVGYVYFIYGILRNRKFRLQFFRIIEKTLSTFFGIKLGNVETNGSYDEIHQRLDGIENSIRNSGFSLKRNTEEKIVSYFKESLDNSLSKEIDEALSAFVANKFAERSRTDAEMHLRSASYRLKSVTDSLSLRGVISLMIGIGSAAGVLWVLHGMIDEIRNYDTNKMPLQTMLYFGAGRVSLALFVTFITYFFLNLYKKSLSDLQHYQSEITNIDLWISAISLSQGLTDHNVKSYLVARLMEADRRPDLRLANISGSGEEGMKLSAELLKEIIKKIP